MFDDTEVEGSIKIIVLMTVMAAIEVAGIVSIVPFLTVLANPSLIDTKTYLKTAYDYMSIFGVSTAENYILALGVFSIILIFISSAFKSLTMHLTNRFIERQRHLLCLKLLTVYLNVNYETISTYKPSVLTKNILSEVDNLTDRVLRPTMLMICYGILVFLITFLLLIFDWVLAVGVIGTFSVIYIFIFTLTKKAQLLYGIKRFESNAERYKISENIFSGWKSLKLNGGEKLYLDQFKVSSSQFSKSIAYQHSLSQIPHYLIEAVAFGGLLVIILLNLFVMGGYDQLSIILPTIGLFTFSAYRVNPALRIIFIGFASLKQGEKAILSLSKEIKLHQQARSKSNAAPLSYEKEIILQDLSYSYKNSKRKNLNNINLRINKNMVIGISGRSGAGKSTLIDVLLGFLTPDSGALFADQTRIQKDNLFQYQDLFGYVPQEIALTNDTILTNISGLSQHSALEFERVRRSADASEIDSFIMTELPDQYNTKLDMLTAGLSGGQRQRIAIARAIYQNPSILILDEATSALDPETEERIINNIRKLRDDMTIVCVTHRSSVLAKCDDIYEVVDGKVLKVE